MENHNFKLVKPNKDNVVVFRVDTLRKKGWAEAMAELGIEDFSSYVRKAVDRSIALDRRSLDPKWQEFLSKVQDIALGVLGYRLIDNPDSRYAKMTATEDSLFARGQQLAKERGVKAPALPGQEKEGEYLTVERIENAGTKEARVIVKSRRRLSRGVGLKKSHAHH